MRTKKKNGQSHHRARSAKRLPRRRKTAQKRKKRTGQKSEKRRGRKSERGRGANLSSKRSTKRGSQHGGELATAIGIGVAATAVAATAYKGYRLLSKVKDKTHMIRLLNQEYIEYAPKVVVTETPDFINHYLNCVSTLEFFQILLSRPEYLTSKTLRGIIKETTSEEKKSKELLDRNHSQEYDEVTKIIDTIEAKGYQDIRDNLQLSALNIETSSDENIKSLKNLLLLTSRISGSSIGSSDAESGDTDSGESKVSPYITVSAFDWRDIIYTGVYDEYYNAAITEILDDRLVTDSLNEADLVRIQQIIEVCSSIQSFKECIRLKMVECSSKPRGYLDFVSPNISWDSQRACLSCPQEDCLIYLYDFYWDFLQETLTEIPILDKLYALMVCEARICVLSKCLALEAIRVQDKQSGQVRRLVHDIYQRDKSSPLDRVSTEVSGLFQTGGGEAEEAEARATGLPATEVPGQGSTEGGPAPVYNLDMPPPDPVAARIAPETAIDPDMALETDPEAITDDIPPIGEGAETETDQVTDLPPENAGEMVDADEMVEADEMPEADEMDEADEMEDEMPEADPNDILFKDKITSEIELYLAERSGDNSEIWNIVNSTREAPSGETVEAILNYNANCTGGEDHDFIEQVLDTDISKVTLLTLYTKLFSEYGTEDKDNAQLTAYIELLYRFIQCNGAALLDILSETFILGPSILFKREPHPVKHDIESMALAINELYSGIKGHIGIVLIWLLTQANEAIEEERDGGSGGGRVLINNEIGKLFAMLSQKQVEYIVSIALKLPDKTTAGKPDLDKRVAVIYNSVPLKTRRELAKEDTMVNLYEIDISLFDIPTFDTDILRSEITDNPKNADARNGQCIEKERAFTDNIRDRVPMVIDSVKIAELERCAPPKKYHKDHKKDQEDQDHKEDQEDQEDQDHKEDQEDQEEIPAISSEDITTNEDVTNKAYDIDPLDGSPAKVEGKNDITDSVLGDTGSTTPDMGSLNEGGDIDGIGSDILLPTPDIPTMSTGPSVPTMPTMPSVPTMPTVPMSSVPTAPALDMPAPSFDMPAPALDMPAPAPALDMPAPAPALDMPAPVPAPSPALDMPALDAPAPAIPTSAPSPAMPFAMGGVKPSMDWRDSFASTADKKRALQPGLAPIPSAVLSGP